MIYIYHSILVTLIVMLNLDGKYNSTAIKAEKENVPVKKEVKWGVKGIGSFSEENDRYLSAEYSNGFNCNDSISMEESQGHESNDAFPLPLNPLFDLSALVMVSKKGKATLKENL